MICGDVHSRDLLPGRRGYVQRSLLRAVPAIWAAAVGVGLSRHRPSKVIRRRLAPGNSAAKCAGLDAVRLAERSVPPSNLSLLGLVRHMSDTEHGWVRQIFRGEQIPDLYYRPDAPDADFEECRVVDAALENARLDDAFPFREKTISARWMWQHLVEEYARHNGHADLLREAIDAAELRASRLAAARSGSSGPSRAGARAASATKPASRPRGTKKTTGGLKKDASTRAVGARRQAKRDSR